MQSKLYRIRYRAHGVWCESYGNTYDYAQALHWQQRWEYTLGWPAHIVECEA